MMVPRKSENSGRSSWHKLRTTERSLLSGLTRLHPFCGRPRPSWIRAACIIQIKSATSLTGRCQPHPQNLIVSDTWAIYARQRSNNVLLGDLDRLKAAVEEAEELPRASTRLVTEPSNERPRPMGGIDIGGPGAGGTGSGQTTGGGEPEEPEDFYFPKPFNEEQIAIIKRLEVADGMVVQGPPGTGKTHTIANIICHCLATGKRVLVTSKAAEPLVEVRNHIPEGIRDLVISLLSYRARRIEAVGASGSCLVQHGRREGVRPAQARNRRGPAPRRRTPRKDRED